MWHKDTTVEYSVRIKLNSLAMACKNNLLTIVWGGSCVCVRVCVCEIIGLQMYKR